MPKIEERLPLILLEDEHLLAIHKPAGVNTHAPSPFAGQGIYDWLRHRQPRWTQLSILHRLDKDTSGVLVFGKTPLANRSLTAQFTSRQVRKRYILASDRSISRSHFSVSSALVRQGSKYVNRPVHAGATQAQTHFALLEQRPGFALWQAEPVTGRTHQIRVHAASQGIHVLGDVLYGGSPAARLFLHAQDLWIQHPLTGVELHLEDPVNFELEVGLEQRRNLIDLGYTDAFRLVHGAADGHPDWYVDQLGPVLLSQGEHPLRTDQVQWLQGYMAAPIGLGALRSCYGKGISSTARGPDAPEPAPTRLLGEEVAPSFVILENGLRFEMRLNEGASIGLFLDQRDNRRRLLINHIASEFGWSEQPKSARVLNTFAYTCGFSVAAACAGARTTSVDLSRKYLEWGRRNFMLNHLDPASHDFIFGDAFQWLRRLARKGRCFDLILLDPPTFSRSKESGAFAVEKDYGRLVAAALPLLSSPGVLFCSTNTARLVPEDFLGMVESEIALSERRILRRHYVPQPLDFPVSRDEPAYLKTIWYELG